MPFPVPHLLIVNFDFKKINIYIPPSAKKEPCLSILAQPPPPTYPQKVDINHGPSLFFIPLDIFQYFFYLFFLLKRIQQQKTPKKCLKSFGKALTTRVEQSGVYYRMLNSMEYNFLREQVKKITIDSLTGVKPGGGGRVHLCSQKKIPGQLVF